MEHKIHITPQFQLATGQVNLNEIVYELEKLRDPLMLQILEQILRSYDDLSVTFFRWQDCKCITY